MSDKIYFSEKLGLNYKIKLNQNNERRIVFEDNVNYSNNEIKILEKANNQTLKNIHNVKKIFGGICE
jgi:hypothetical protein